MELYEQIAAGFDPISLDAMGDVQLMNRSDDKYLFHIDLLPAVLNRAFHDYQILEINQKRIMGYESLYFDTSDHEMYLHHHNQKLNRYKVRIRQYLDSQDFFLEVKFKNNKRRTRKLRIPVTGYNSLFETSSKEFVSSNSPYTVEKIEPKLSTKFDRITLVNPPGNERITLDINLNLHNDSQSITIPYLVTAEVKREKSAESRGFGRLLLEERIFSKRISKYCVGTNLLFPEIKHNRLKPKILYLNKLDRTKQYDKLYSAII